ncbi:unnamed protein product [Pleuronectes platessa]|uniref:Uncharacterized protein n=1 Tax=Pleuronectes platessa TaxID=8262 RepID=A0A9N7U4S1_PLEPL|nr:unnamed protein product [Pleuronectes platessa]
MLRALSIDMVQRLSSGEGKHSHCLKLNTGLPASATFELLFSCAGLLFTAKRARMSSTHLENQLLLKLNKKFPAIIQRLAKPLLHPILLPAQRTFTSSGSRPQRIADYANGSRIIAAPNHGGS